MFSARELSILLIETSTRDLIIENKTDIPIKTNKKSKNTYLALNLLNCIDIN
jgi:hypothetical protein